MADLSRKVIQSSAQRAVSAAAMAAPPAVAGADVLVLARVSLLDENRARAGGALRAMRHCCRGKIPRFKSAKLEINANNSAS